MESMRPFLLGGGGVPAPGSVKKDKPPPLAEEIQSSSGIQVHSLQPNYRTLSEVCGPSFQDQRRINFHMRKLAKL